MAAPALARRGARPVGAHRAVLRSLSRPAPLGRVGVVWAVVTAAAVAGGPWALAGWLALGSVVAVAAVVRTWSRPWARPDATGRARPSSAAALLAGVAAPLAAAAGVPAFAAVLLAALAVGVVSRRRRLVAAARVAVRGRPASPVEQAAVVGVELVALGLCAGALVLTERASVTALAALLALVCCHDASRYLVGTGAPAAWEGAAAVVAAVGSAALAVAVLQPSPVTGGYVWLLAAIVAFGGVAGRPLSRLLVPAGHPVPGVWRRLDTLLVAAPVWLLVVAAARF